MRIKHVAISAAAIAVLGLSAGCGPETSDQHGKAAPAGDAQASAGSGASGHGTELKATLERAYSTTTDAKTAKISMTAKTSGGHTGSTTMTGVVRFSPLAEKGTIHTAGRTIEAIVVDGTAYIRLGSSWRTIDLSQLSTGAMQDPTQALSYLRGVSSSVHETGSKTIRGVRASGYAATVDVQKAAAKQSGKAAAALTKLADQGVSSVPVEVWLDSAGRVVRLHSTLTVKAGGESTTVDATTDLYDYGTSVHISAPAGA